MSNFDDFLNILSDQKKKLNFTGSAGTKRFSVNFPISFTKNDLYTYLSERNGNEKVLLFYNYDIIYNDDSSINDIPDSSTIILFPHTSYKYFKNSILYKFIINLFPNDPLINIVAKTTTGIVFTFPLPINITVGLLYKLILITLDLDIKENFLYCNGKNLKINDKTKIGDSLKILNCSTKILINNVDSAPILPFKGKLIKATIYFENKGIFQCKYFGKYNSTGSLYEVFLKDKQNDNLKIYYKRNELKRYDNHSLASIGINDDFECVIK